MIDVAKTRASQIDALRAFSVFAVVFSHTSPPEFHIRDFSFYEFGAYGVYMFFVISAFLITTQLIETKQVWLSRREPIVHPLKSFYAKRILRLMPAYYLALFAAVAVDLGTVRQEFWWHLFQSTNILFGIDQAAEENSPVGHLWSLSMEWQFYLVWPAVVLLLSGTWLLVVTIAILLFSIGSWSVLDLPDAFELTSIPISLDSLAVGALLAIGVHRRWPIDRFLWLGWIAALIAMAGLGLFALGHKTAGENFEFVTHEAMNFVFAVLVYMAARGSGGWWGRLLDNHALQYVGVISYGIYLYHQYITSCSDGLAKSLGRSEIISPGPIYTVVIFAASTAVAAFSWRYFEAPINGFRQRFSYRADEAGRAEPEPSLAIAIAGATEPKV